MDMYILVVEDDVDGQEVVRRMLRHRGISHDEAYNAEEGLALLQHNPYTAVIIDLNLPGMDGWSLLSAVQSDPALMHLPCIAVTAYHSADVAVKAIEAGFKAYFPKPLDATSFVRELTRVLEKA